MDIRQLSYFIEVAKLKSFTKASQSLHLSQPTLSKMVKNLEEEVGMELLDRSARQSELTDAGEIVFIQGEKILNMLDELSILLHDMENLKKGKIKIGLPPLIGILFFPQIIKGFQEIYPDITINLVEHGANKVIQMVEDGLLDFGVVILPVDESKFDITPFASEELMLFVHYSHPLASKKEVSIYDVKNQPIILFNEDFTLHNRIIQECTNSGFSPTVAYESSQWDFISDMVGNNLGIAFFPQSITKKINQESIKAIPINPTIPWNLAIILKKGKYVSHATNAFLEYISSVPL
ncbi:LysR family transcriptional regulator (plasmid) [Bacillus mycoides]|nr:LysR family transcriptional regulator [Bacillus mycoides]